MELVALEVVPSAVEADLDDVTGELLVGGFQLRQLLGRRDTATIRLAERVAVHVRDETQAGVAADRTIAILDVTDVAPGPQQLGMGVADIAPVASARAEVPENGPAGQRVVHMTAHGAECRATARRSRAGTPTVVSTGAPSAERDLT